MLEYLEMMICGDLQPIIWTAQRNDGPKKTSIACET